MSSWRTYSELKITQTFDDSTVWFHFSGCNHSRDVLSVEKTVLGYNYVTRWVFLGHVSPTTLEIFHPTGVFTLTRTVPQAEELFSWCGSKSIYFLRGPAVECIDELISSVL